MAERDEIESYYDRAVEREWTRMDRRPIEFELTRRHVESLLLPSSRLLDIGSGPGRYSIHWARKGHRLTLVDLSRNNLQRAATEAAQAGIHFEECIHASATDLHCLPSESYDAVLCLGPLYHLTESRDRDLALAECRRVVASAGLVFVAFLSPYAHAISALMSAQFSRILESGEEYDYILENRRNRGSGFLNFTYAWYPRPSDIRSYMESHGFRTDRVAALEPLGWSADERIGDMPEKGRDAWYEYLYRISTDSSLLGACQHILYCGRKA